MQISNSEKILMDVLWSGATKIEPMSAKQIIQQVDQGLGWHDKTVKTLLNRLLQKKAVDYKKNGREYHYFPILNQADYVEGAADNFLKRVFNGSVTSLVASFAKQEKLTAKDISELKELISSMENSEKENGQ